MTGRWTAEHLIEAQAAWAAACVRLRDTAPNDDALLAAVERQTGVTQAELYYQRIEADRSAGVFRALADPGKASPPVRPVAPAAVWRLGTLDCLDGPVTVLRDPDGLVVAYALGADNARIEKVASRLNGSAWLAVRDAL